MTDTASPPLAYGTIDTQFGVTCQDRPDGGIVVTIPSTAWNYACRIIPVPFPVNLIWIMARYVAAKQSNRQLPSRAVIKLTSEQLFISEADPHSSNKSLTQSWLLAEFAEVRPNRYSRGLYVRIAGKDNFDMFGDVDRRLVEHVGGRLSAALERLRSSADRSR